MRYLIVIAIAYGVIGGAVALLPQASRFGGDLRARAECKASLPEEQPLLVRARYRQLQQR
jgi:hypothetical protein